MKDVALRVAVVLRSALPSFWDLHVYGGVALVAFGAWLVYRPAGLVLGGLLLLSLGLWFTRNSERRR